MSTPPTSDPGALVISFAGWGIMRLPTDPDPMDEKRGVSGYSFAFAGEPDLDRILRFQPPRELARSHGPELGVTVVSAIRTDGRPVDALVGATVDLLGDPILENRNWTLTLPGYEPIVPFDLQIDGGRVRLRRFAPLNPGEPDQPVWQASPAVLTAQGAHGMEFEPATIGEATGIWDPLALVTERLAALRADLAALQRDGGDPVAITALEGRINELEFAVATPTDRRVIARCFVERFGFPLTGAAEVVVSTDDDPLAGTLNTNVPWMVNFWLGAWDPDLLCLYATGALTVPYATKSD